MLPYIGGRSNTTDALRMLRDVIFQRRNGDRVSARNVAILIASGESTLYSHQVELAYLYRRDISEFKARPCIKILIFELII